MDSKIKEIKKDIDELKLLEKQALRQKVKDILSIEIRRLISDVVKLDEEQNKNAASTPINEKGIVSPTGNKCYQVKLNNYAWDQSQKFLKLYVTLPKVQTLPPENVDCHFTNKMIELQVKNLDSKDFIFTIKNLLYNINPGKSSWKIKTDMIVILAAKETEQNWSHVTEYEKKASDSKQLMPDKPDDTSDPSDSLMSMMKKMYDQGDDEMKRIIAKAWTEGQQNKQMEM